MVGILLASIVLPDPGGPIIKRLWLPLTAISMALFVCACPLISEKLSPVPVPPSSPSAFTVRNSSRDSPPLKKWTISRRCLAPKILMSCTTDASLPFSCGTIMFAIFSLRASIAVGKIPRTLFILPSSDNSPAIRKLLIVSFFMIFNAVRIPNAMGRSKDEPSFLTSAGARFIVILSLGNSNPAFLIADLTLSLLSFTEVSGRPTILKAGRPKEISTSTSIFMPSMP